MTATSTVLDWKTVTNRTEGELLAWQVETNAGLIVPDLLLLQQQLRRQQQRLVLRNQSQQLQQQQQQQQESPSSTAAASTASTAIVAVPPPLSLHAIEKFSLTPKRIEELEVQVCLTNIAIEGFAELKIRYPSHARTHAITCW